MRLKIRSVGTSLGMVLPKHVMARLRLTKGDTVFLTEAPNGFQIIANDPEFEEQMILAEKVMKKRRDALRALAKS
jgi:putative addiction module antidote